MLVADRARVFFADHPSRHLGRGLQDSVGLVIPTLPGRRSHLRRQARRAPPRAARSSSSSIRRSPTRTSSSASSPSAATPSRFATTSSCSTDSRWRACHVDGPCEYDDYSSETGRWEKRALRRVGRDPRWAHLPRRLRRRRAAPARCRRRPFRPTATSSLGDNRDNSDDSRFWGFVPPELIKGIARKIWWSSGPEGVRWSASISGSGSRSGPHWRCELFAGFSSTLWRLCPSVSPLRPAKSAPEADACFLNSRPGVCSPTTRQGIPTMGMRAVAAGWVVGLMALAARPPAAPGDLLRHRARRRPAAHHARSGDGARRAPSRTGLCIVAGARSTISVASAPVAAVTAPTAVEVGACVPRFARAAAVAATAGTSGGRDPADSAPWTLELTGTLKRPAWAGNALFLFFDLEDPEVARESPVHGALPGGGQGHGQGGGAGLPVAGRRFSSRSHLPRTGCAAHQRQANRPRRERRLAAVVAMRAAPACQASATRSNVR